MSAVQLMREMINTPEAFVGLTVEQYHRMIERRILEEELPIELLEGFLVRKNRAKAGEDARTVGDEHRWAVENLKRVLAPVSAHACHLTSQQPVMLPPDGPIKVRARDSCQAREAWGSCWSSVETRP